MIFHAVRTASEVGGRRLHQSLSKSRIKGRYSPSLQSSGAAVDTAATKVDVGQGEHRRPGENISILIHSKRDMSKQTCSYFSADLQLGRGGKQISVIKNH